MEVLYGLHPVSEALKAGRRRFDHVLVARERHDDRLDRVIAQCRDAGIRVREESREQLTLAANTPAHQGVVALVRPQEFLTIEDLFEPDPATNKSPAGKSGLPASSSRSMASKTHRTSALFFASPMARVSMASSLPSAAPLLSAPSLSKPAPEPPSTFASRASSISSAPLRSSRNTTSGSLGLTRGPRCRKSRRGNC